MTRSQCHAIWRDSERIRAFAEGWVRSAPELFPAGFGRGDRLHDFGRRSRKLPGLRLRKVVTDDRSSYWLRASFQTSFMTGTVDELAYPLLLAVHGVPAWLLKVGFGRGEMDWYRVVARLGRGSLVETTVRNSARLPEYLAADEHHADWAGQKGYVATTVGGGCILGVALTAADDIHLRGADGVFAAEARDVDPGYAPRRLKPKVRRRPGTPSPRSSPRSRSSPASRAGSSRSAKVRDRCRKAHDLHRRVWDMYRAATAEEFCRLVGELQQWCTTQTLTTPVRERVAKLWARKESYAVASDHPGCHRASNAADPADEPVVPDDVRGPGPARRSGVVRVATEGLGAAGELPAVRAAV